MKFITVACYFFLNVSTSSFRIPFYVVNINPWLQCNEWTFNLILLNKDCLTYFLRFSDIIEHEMNWKFNLGLPRLCFISRHNFVSSPNHSALPPPPTPITRYSRPKKSSRLSWVCRTSECDTMDTDGALRCGFEGRRTHRHREEGW